MAFIKVIGMFDHRDRLECAHSGLLAAHLATDATMRVEPEPLSEDVHPPASSKGWWHRLKELLAGEGDERIGAYAEGIRRGSVLLVVTVDEQQADDVREIMRRCGAVDIRRRIRRWMATGWQSFDPAGLAFTEEEIIEERRCISEEEIAAADGGDGKDDGHELRNVRLFDEATGRELGRISESELAVLQDALEEEGPDDDDYWINPDEIDDLACRPGATAYLIRLLRTAVGDNPDGIDIAFQREDEQRQSLRHDRGARAARGAG